MDAQQDKRIADFAADIARNFSDGDVHFAEDTIKSGIAHDPVSTLLAIARMNDEYGFIGEGENRTRRPFAYGEMDIIRSTINTVANHPTYEPNDTVGNEALRDAVCSTLLRALETDPTATLDIGAAGERQTDDQVANSALMAKGPAQAIAGAISILKHPEHRLDISERLLVWADENTGSLPDAFRRRFVRVNIESHDQLRNRDIEAGGQVRPEQTFYQQQRAAGWNGQK